MTKKEIRGKGMDLLFKNIMEDAVLMKLDEIMNNYQMCNCEKCRFDVASYALNQLPPKYVASSKGELYSKAYNLVKQHELDIVSALVKACMVVKDNPRHIA